MRHLATLIAAMVIAPLVWVMLAFGQDRSIQAFANGEGDAALANIDFIRPFAFLAGLLYAGSYFALLLEPTPSWTCCRGACPWPAVPPTR
jgi:hypothetical protein